jgi:hypothetical protein
MTALALEEKKQDPELWKKTGVDPAAAVRLPAPPAGGPLTKAPGEEEKAGPGVFSSIFGGLFGGGESEEKKGGGLGGLLGGMANGLGSASEWSRENLPGLLAAPVGGTLGALGGLARAGQGAADGTGAAEGLQAAKLDALGTVGLKEVVGEGFDQKSKNLPTGLNMPPTLAGDIRDVRQQLPEDSHMNGMHSWHAGTNAALANRLGPAAAIPLWLAGVVHESPLDYPSFQAEEKYQGTVNHILDSSMDIVSNTIGIGLGLALPREQAIKAAIKLGNLIPGPGDPDPEFGGNGKYAGDPTKAWGQYPGRK